MPHRGWQLAELSCAKDASRDIGVESGPVPHSSYEVLKLQAFITPQQRTIAPFSPNN